MHCILPGVFEIINNNGVIGETESGHMTSVWLIIFFPEREGIFCHYLKKIICIYGGLSECSLNK